MSVLTVLIHLFRSYIVIPPKFAVRWTYKSCHVRKGESCPLVWDLRDSPSTAAQLVQSTMKQKLTRFRHLQSQHATTPAVSALHIHCDFLPYRRISARNKQGVTVRDVLEAIYNAVRTPLALEEWEELSLKQKLRVKRVYDIRWRDATIPEKERTDGVRWVDCLLQCTRFAGLSMSYDNDFECILTLSRNFD